MVYTRKRNSKKRASKRNGKSKTLRKKNKSRKNLKKVSGGFMGLFKGQLVIKNNTQIYKMVEAKYDEQNLDKKDRFLLKKYDMIDNAGELGFPTALNYILARTKTVSGNVPEPALKLTDDEITLLQSLKGKEGELLKFIKVNDDGNIIEKPKEEIDAEEAEEDAEQAAKQAAKQAEEKEEAKQAAEIKAEIKAARDAREEKEAKERAAMIAAESPEQKVAREAREAEDDAKKAKAKTTAESNERMRQLSMKHTADQNKCTKSGKEGAELEVCRARGY